MRGTPRFPWELLRSKAAFSLPELALAIGILAFAFVSLLGLLPAGLQTFRKSMDTSTTSFIAHRLVNEAQQADFRSYVKNYAGVQVEPRNFDEQGEALDDANGVLIPANKVRVIYQANISVVKNPALPGAPNSDNMAVVTIQIANNPTGKDLGPGGTLWDPARARQLNVPIVTYSTMIAGNNIKLQ